MIERLHTGDLGRMGADGLIEINGSVIVLRIVKLCQSVIAAIAVHMSTTMAGTDKG